MSGAGKVIYSIVITACAGKRRRKEGQNVGIGGAGST